MTNNKIQNYQTLLPRGIPYPTQTCQYINSTGDRCANKANYEVYMPGDPEQTIDGVCVNLCEEHFGDNDNFI